MARIESDKEDLIAEATALIHRVEFSRELPANAETQWNIATVGFRKDGSLSAYFEQDPFYQFDSSGLLRRALENDSLFRSEGSTLARLVRQRDAKQTRLARVDLDKTELEAFRLRMRLHVQELFDGLNNQTVLQLRAVTSNVNFQSDVVTALQRVLQKDTNFLSPAINMRG